MKSQRNIDVEAGPLMAPGDKEILAKAQEAIEFVGNGKLGADVVFEGPRQTATTFLGGGTGIPERLFGYHLDWIFEQAAKISEALGDDPVRDDFDQIARAPSLPFAPLTADHSLSEQRVAAANELLQSGLTLVASLSAASLSLDRYAGASEANDLQWASQQARALIHHERNAGHAAAKAAASVRAIIDALKREGVTDVKVTREAAIRYQEALRTGPSPFMTAAAQIVEATGVSVAEYRRRRLATHVDDLSGSVFRSLEVGISALQRVSEVLLRQGPAPSVTAEGIASRFVGLGEVRVPVAVRSPSGLEPVILTLRMRRIDVPADWMLSVRPSSLELAPGEQRDVDVHLRAVSPALQGTVCRVAVEGYIGDALINGVVIDVFVPDLATDAALGDAWTADVAR